MKKRFQSIDRYFKISARGSRFSVEIVGGIITFLAMLYILPVNASMLSDAGMDYGAVFLSTALASAVGCLLMGIIGNFPVGLAPGMGLNALFTYAICVGMGKSWQEALVLVLTGSLIFIIVSITPLRQKIVVSIPKSFRHAISAGAGAFIALVGLVNAGIITSYPADTIVEFVHIPTPQIFLALAALVIVFIIYGLKHRINKFAAIIAIMVTTIGGLILHYCGVDGMPSFDNSQSLNPRLIGGFLEGFAVFKDPTSYALIFTIFLVNFFDSTGTIIMGANMSNLVDEKGNVENYRKIFLADSLSSTTAAILGVSTVVPYVESTIGIKSGARTGLAAIVTGVLFLLSLLLFPFFSLFANSPATTSVALILVGAMMFSNLREITWDDKTAVVSAFVTVFGMAFCYSITDGLALGFIVYTLMTISSGEKKRLNFTMIFLTFIFILNFVVKFIFQY